jgi:hypothetical protein
MFGSRMFGRRRSEAAVNDEELEGLRDLYRGLGLGFPAAASRLFDDEAGTGGSEWHVKVFGRLARRLRARDLTSTDLFALPDTWEVMRAEIRGLRAGRDTVTVSGFLYCRPRGSWEHLRLPLLHIWTLRLGRALRFENVLDGIELSLAEGTVSRAA